MSGDHVVLALILVLIVVNAVLIGVYRLIWEPDASSPQVRVLGRYSALLTWLKYRRLPGMKRRSAEALLPARLPAQVESLTLARLAIPLDLGLILVVAVLFGRGVLNLNADRVLTGSEWDVFAAQDIVLLRSGQFPLWNPYLNGGAPFLADPFFHVFNPVIGLPVLAWGEVNGMKIALLLSFFVAGAGQYLLGYHLGLSRPARLWASALFVMNGQFAARFWQGHYNFLPTAAWIPWVILSALMCFKSRRKWPVIVGAVAIALMWLSGNPYYPVYVAAALLAIVVMAAVQFDAALSVFQMDRIGLIRVAAMGLLGLLLAAVAFLPQLELTPRLSKINEPGLEGSQPLHRAVINFLADDRQFADSEMLGKLPIEEEYYAYIGAMPFIFMLCLPLALRPGRRRDVLALIGVLLVMFVWADAKNSIVGVLYDRLPALVNFRYPSRVLILGVCVIPLLGAYGLDELIRRVRDISRDVRLAGMIKDLPAGDGAARTVIVGGVPVRSLAVLIVAGLAASGVWSVYEANSPIVTTVPRFTTSDAPLDWLQQHDRSVYYLNSPQSSGWHQGILSHGFYWMNAWYGWYLRRSGGEEWDVSIPDLQLNGKYLLVAPGVIPLEPDAQLLRLFEGADIYRLPSSPPYAFVYRRTASAESSSGRMIAAVASWNGPNELSVSAAAGPGDYIVALVNHYPGWSVTVDGAEQSPLNVSGYLGAAAQPGQHVYRFVFSPLSVKLGLALSLIGACGLLGYGAWDRIAARRHTAKPAQEHR